MAEIVTFVAVFHHHGRRALAEPVAHSPEVLSEGI